MDQQKCSFYLSKSGGIQNTAIDRFCKHLYYLQVRINDFIYFHTNDDDNEYSDLTQKSQELYNIADKSISSILEFIKPDETSPIISKNDAICYIKGIYKDIKNKDSIYHTLKKSLKELCQSRNPDDFQEMFFSSDVCLERLGIQLNNDELKLFKNKLKKVFQNETKLDQFVDEIQDLKLSEEKEILLGQVLSEYCLYISLKLLKQSKSNFKESCRKIDEAYRNEIENTILNLTSQISSLREENESMKQLNEKNAIKLKENEIQIDELQELLDMKSIQNKKLSDEIMELKGNASPPDIIYKLDDSSDAEIDTSEILSFLTATEPIDNDPNVNFLSKARNVIPPSFEEDECDEIESKPNKLTIPIIKSYSKKAIVGKTNKKPVNSIKNNKDNKEDRSIDNSELLAQIQAKDAIIKEKDDKINEKEDTIRQLTFINQTLLSNFKKICHL